MSSSIHVWFHLNYSHKPYCEITITTVENAKIHASPLAILKGRIAHDKSNGLPFSIILITYTR